MQQARIRLGKADAAAETPNGALSIGSKVTIIGSVEFDGQIEIAGTVQGEIRCASVNVARYGTVTGLIIADEVTISGGVNGSIYANKLVLKDKCDVEGEIYHRELSLEDGSYFDGKSRPHKEPLDLAEAGKPPAPALPKFAA